MLQNYLPHQFQQVCKAHFNENGFITVIIAKSGLPIPETPQEILQNGVVKRVKKCQN